VSEGGAVSWVWVGLGGGNGGSACGEVCRGEECGDAVHMFVIAVEGGREEGRCTVNPIVSPQDAIL
jgi:hypothetical protein